MFYQDLQPYFDNYRKIKNQYVRKNTKEKTKFQQSEWQKDPFLRGYPHKTLTIKLLWQYWKIIYSIENIHELRIQLFCLKTAIYYKYIIQKVFKCHKSDCISCKSYCKYLKNFKIMLKTWRYIFKPSFEKKWKLHILFKKNNSNILHLVQVWATDIFVSLWWIRDYKITQIHISKLNK